METWCFVCMGGRTTCKNISKALKKSHFKIANPKFNDIDHANLKNLRTPEV